MTASKTDALVPTGNNGDGKADPGDTITYTVNIGATGEDATGVAFDDTVDTNTSFVPGSLTVTPVAIDDSYTATGNVRIQVPAASGVLLAGEDDYVGIPSATLSGFGATSGTANGTAVNGTNSVTTTNGGAVILAADGSFSYNPPPGFEGADSFFYTLTNSAGSNVGQVTITVSGMLWFINNNAGACSSDCNGRLTNPFTSLAAFEAVNGNVGVSNPAAGDNIFIYESATAYVGPVTLENNQQLIGQDAVGASLAALAGITLAPNSDALPSLSPGGTLVTITSAGNAINVASGNTLRGFTVGDSVTDINGLNFGTLTVADVTLTGTGEALNLTTGTLAATFASISSTNSTLTGLTLIGVAGSLTSGSTTVTNPAGIGIRVDTSSATLNFANTISTQSGSAGVSLTTNTGPITFGSLDISPDQNQKGLLATNNTQTITATSGTISTSAALGTTNAAAVEVTRATGTTPLALSFTSVSTNGGTNGIILTNTSGSFTVTGNGVNAQNGTGGTIQNLSGADGTTEGRGISLSNVSNFSIRQMNLLNFSNFAIRGSSVTGFSMLYSAITGTNGTAAGAFDEAAINFDNLLGSATISNNNIAHGFEFIVKILNSSGSLNRLTMESNTFGVNNVTLGGDAVQIVASSTATVNVTANSNTFTNAREDLFNAVVTQNANMDLVFRINTLSNNHTNKVAASSNVLLFSTSTGTVTYDMSCNKMTTGATGSALAAAKGVPDSGSGGTMTGTMNNNRIGLSGVVGSGSEFTGIFASALGSGTHTTAITNNIIYRYNEEGIFLKANDPLTGGNAVLNATVTGNQTLEPDSFAFAGIWILAGSGSGTETHVINVVLGNATNAALKNDFSTGDPNDFSDVEVDELGSGSAINLSRAGSAGVTVEDVIKDDNLNPLTTAVAPSGTINLVNTTPATPPAVASCVPPAAPATMSADELQADSDAKPDGNSDDKLKDIMMATRGEGPGEGNLHVLRQAELMWAVQAATSRWIEAGIPAEAIARMQAMTFEMADLPDGQLASADSTQVKIDANGAGYGWYLDVSPLEDSEFDIPVRGKERQATEYSSAFGQMDLLTVVMRQLGRALGGEKLRLESPQGWLLQNTLSTGTRRAPAFKTLDIGKLRRPSDSVLKRAPKATVAAQPNGSNAESARKVERRRRLTKNSHHASVSNSSLADVSVTIGRLPAGETVTITFQVTVDNPFQGATAQVSNQGTVSGTNFSSVLTDDPSVNGPADPTVTPVDLPDVTVAVAPASVLEDGSDNLVYTFTREGSTTDSMTVNFSVTGSATFSTDYTQSGAATFNGTGTVVIASGSATATVTVDPTPDSPVEPDETVVLTVTSGTGYEPGTPASASGTITNDDTDVSVAVSPLSVDEDGVPNLVYTFTRTGVTAGTLTVNFTVGGTATFNPPGDDYTQTGATTFDATSGTVSFTAGSPTATVTVDPTADATVETNETVVLTVASGTGYNIGAPSVASGTINNDDTAVTVAVSPESVLEDGATNMVYTFTRTDGDGALTVNFSVGGTATFGGVGADYTQIGATTFDATSGTVTFPDTVLTAQVTVDPTADATTEPNETVILTVTAGTGYTPGTPNSATGTITNDDVGVSVAVSPSSVTEDGATNLVYTFTRTDSTGALTVNFSASGTASFSGPGADYTQTGAATFDGTNGTVAFADGNASVQVTVDPTADTTVEPDETLTLTVTSGAGYEIGTPASAQGTITNDDTDVTVAVSPSSTFEDGAGNLVYTFTRSGVTTGALTVNFSVGGTATFGAGNDYTQSGAASFTPPTGTVTFSAGSPTATVTVDPNTDDAAESDETVILTVTGGTGYNVAIPNSATGTITNDDAEVTVAVSPSSVLEDGATNMIYTFTRTGFTTPSLTVSFTVGGTAIFAPPDTDYTQTGAASFTNTAGTVTFLAGSSTATITVDPFGDSDPEPNETVILTLVPGTGYSVGTPGSATGTILTDDASPPTVQVGYGQCNAVSNGTFNLILADADSPVGTLTLSASSSNTAVVPNANITFGGSGANRTVTINAVPQLLLAFSDVTITVSDGTLSMSINIRVIVGTNGTESINIGTTTVGSDMIFGRNGDDTINAGAGNDLVCGGNSGGIINAGLGDDTVDGGNGNDTLLGGDGNDLLLGGGGNDTLEGGNNDDTLNGGGGTDTLRGQGGDDTMTGGSGPDSFNGGPGNDTVTDFHAGQDTKVDIIEVGTLFPGLLQGEVFGYVALARPWWDSPFPEVVRFAFLRGGM